MQYSTYCKNDGTDSLFILYEHILAPLGYTRKDAWLCDLLPETRINSSQAKVIKEKYNPLIEQYGLNPVTIPSRPTVFCDLKRCEEILAELKESQAELLVLLGDIPILSSSLVELPI